MHVWPMRGWLVLACYVLPDSRYEPSCMTTRVQMWMIICISVHAELATDAVRMGLEMEADETRGRTRLFNSSTLDMISFMDFIPRAIRGDGVYATFIKGYSLVFMSIARVTERKVIPTADAVLRDALEDTFDYFDAQAVRFFLQKGGRVEHALNGLLHTAREQVHSRSKMRFYCLLMPHRDLVEMDSSSKHSEKRWALSQLARTTKTIFSFAPI